MGVLCGVLPYRQKPDPHLSDVSILWDRTSVQPNIEHDEIVKSPSMAFLLTGKRKVRFLLSLQINHLRSKQLICAPVHGRDDDFLQSHQNMASAKPVRLKHSSQNSVKPWPSRSSEGRSFIMSI